MSKQIGCNTKCAWINYFISVGLWEFFPYFWSFFPLYSNVFTLKQKSVLVKFSILLFLYHIKCDKSIMELTKRKLSINIAFFKFFCRCLSSVVHNIFTHFLIVKYLLYFNFYTGNANKSQKSYWISNFLKFGNPFSE